jgi:hypothetical protein
MTASFSESITPACEPASFAVDSASTAIYNEACDLTNTLHPHWTEVMNSVSEMGVEGMENRLRQAQRILRDDGATYNLNGDPLSPNVWSLDIIPNLLAEEEWSSVERGLAQRSRLFDLMLKDLYGEQRLLKEGLSPRKSSSLTPVFCVNATVSVCLGPIILSSTRSIWFAAGMDSLWRLAIAPRPRAVPVMFWKTESPFPASCHRCFVTAMSGGFPVSFMRYGIRWPASPATKPIPHGSSF